MGKIRRSLSMLLSIAMIMTSLYVPAPVYAAEDEAVIATGGSEENVDITSQGEESSPEEDRELPGVEEKDEIIDDSEFEGQIESENIDLSSSEEDAYVIEDRPMPEVVEEPVEDEPEILGLSYEADDAIEQIIEDRAVFEADDDLSSIVSAVKPSGKVSNPIYLDYEYVENEDLNLYGIAHYSDPSDASVARYSADGYKFGDNSTKRVLEVKGNKDVAFFEFTVNDISKISVWAKSANTTDTLQIYEVAKSDMETAGYHKVTLAGGDTEYRAIGDAFTAADYVTGVQIDSDGSKAPYVLTVPATNDEPVTYALASKDGGWFVNGIDVLATGAEEYAVNSSKRNIAHSFTVENDDNTYTYTVDQEDHYYYVGTDDSEPAFPKAKRGDLITLKVLDETKAGVPSVTYKDGDDDVTLTIDDGITVVKPGKEFTFVMPAFDVTIAMEAGSVYYKLGVVDSDEFWQSVTSVKLTDTESSLTKTINTVAKESQLNKILEGIKVQINPKDNPGYATYVSITSPTAFEISYYDAAGTAKVYDPENTVPTETSTKFADTIDVSKPVEFDMPADDVAVDVRLKDYAYHVYAADESSKADFEYTVNSTVEEQKKTPVLEESVNNVEIKSLDTVRIYPVDVAGDHRVGAIEYQPVSADPATDPWTALKITGADYDATGGFWTIDMPAENIRIKTVRAYYVKRGDTFGTDLSVTVSAEKGIEPDIVETLSTVDVTADDDGEAYVYPGDVITVTTTINRSLGAYKRIDSMENGNGEDGHKLFKPESILVKDIVKDGDTVPVQESVFSAVVPDNNKPVVLNIGTAVTKDVTFDFGDGIKEINLTGYPKTDSSKAVAIDESVSKISKPATGTTATVKGVYDVNDSVGFTVSTEPVAAWKVYGAPSVTVDGNDSLVGPDTEKNNEYRFMTDAAQTVKVSATPYWNLATQLKYGTDDVQAYSADANVVNEVAVTVAEGSDPIVNPTVKATATAAEKSTLFLTDYDSVENTNAENDTNRNKIKDGTVLKNLTFTVPSNVTVTSVALGPYDSENPTAAQTENTYVCVKVNDTTYTANLVKEALAGYKVKGSTVLQINYGSAQGISVAANDCLAIGTEVAGETPAQIHDKILYTTKTTIDGGVVKPIDWSTDTISGHTFTAGQTVYLKPAMANDYKDKVIVTGISMSEVGSTDEAGKIEATLVTPAYTTPAGTTNTWDVITDNDDTIYASPAIWSITVPSKAATLTVETTPLYVVTRENYSNTSFDFNLKKGEGKAEKTVAQVYYAAFNANVTEVTVPAGAEFITAYGNAENVVTPVLMYKTTDAGADIYESLKLYGTHTYMFEGVMPEASAFLYTTPLAVNIVKDDGSDASSFTSGFEVVAEDDDAGEIVESKTKKYAQGADVVLYLKPADGYTIDTVKIGTTELEPLEEQPSGLAEGVVAYGFTKGATDETVTVTTEKYNKLSLKYVTDENVVNSATTYTAKHGLVGAQSNAVKVYKLDKIKIEDKDAFKLGAEVTDFTDTHLKLDGFALIVEPHYQLLGEVAVCNSANLETSLYEVYDDGGKEVTCAAVYGALTGDTEIRVNVVPTAEVGVKTRVDGKVDAYGKPEYVAETTYTGYTIAAANAAWTTGYAGETASSDTKSTYKVGTTLTIAPAEGYRIRNVKVGDGTVAPAYSLKPTADAYALTLLGVNTNHADDVNAFIKDANALEIAVDVVPLRTVTVDKDNNELRSEPGYAGKPTFTVKYVDDSHTVKSDDSVYGKYYLDADDSGTGIAGKSVKVSRDDDVEFNASAFSVVTVEAAEGYLLEEVSIASNEYGTKTEIAGNSCTITGLKKNANIKVITVPAYTLEQAPDVGVDSASYTVEYKLKEDGQKAELIANKPVGVYKDSFVTIAPKAGYRVIGVVAKNKAENPAVYDDPAPNPVASEKEGYVNSGNWEYTIPAGNVVLTVTTVPLNAVIDTTDTAGAATAFPGVKIVTGISNSNAYETDAVTVEEGTKYIPAAVGDRVTFSLSATDDDTYTGNNKIPASEVDFGKLNVTLSGVSDTVSQENKILLMKDGVANPDTALALYEITWDPIKHELSFNTPKAESALTIKAELTQKSYKVTGKATQVTGVSDPVTTGTVTVSKTGNNDFAEAVTGVKIGDTVYLKVVSKPGYELDADEVGKLKDALVFEDSLGAIVTVTDEWALTYAGSDFPALETDGSAVYPFSFKAPNEDITVSATLRARHFGLSLSETGVVIKNSDGTDWPGTGDSKTVKFACGVPVLLMLYSVDDFGRTVDDITVTVSKMGETEWELDTAISTDGKLGVTGTDGVFTIEEFDMPAYDILLTAVAEPAVYTVELDDTTKELIKDGTQIEQIVLSNITKPDSDFVIYTKDNFADGAGPLPVMAASAKDRIGVYVKAVSGYKGKSIAVNTVADNSKLVSEVATFTLPARADLTDPDKDEEYYKAGYKGVLVSVAMEKSSYGVYSKTTNVKDIAIEAATEGDYIEGSGLIPQITPKYEGVAKYQSVLTMKLTPDENSQFDYPEKQIALSEEQISEDETKWVPVNTADYTLEASTAEGEEGVYILTYTMKDKNILIEASASEYNVFPGEIDAHVKKVTINAGVADEDVYSTVPGQITTSPGVRVGTDFVIKPVVADGYEIDKVTVVKAVEKAVEGGVDIVASGDPEDITNTATEAEPNVYTYAYEMPAKGTTEGYVGVLVNVSTKPVTNELNFTGRYSIGTPARASIKVTANLTGKEDGEYTAVAVVDGKAAIDTDVPVKVNIVPDIDYNLGITSEDNKYNAAAVTLPEGLTDYTTESDGTQITYSFKMLSGDATIDVEPVATKFTYVADDSTSEMDEYVAITAASEEGVYPNEEITLTLTSKPGYSISEFALKDVEKNNIQVVVNQTKVEGEGEQKDVLAMTLTFTMPRGGAVLSVGKNARKYDISVASSHTTVAIIGAGETETRTATIEDTVQFKATAEADYELSSIEVVDKTDEVYYSYPEATGVEKLEKDAQTGNYTFKMVPDDVIIKAVSTAKTYDAKVSTTSDKADLTADENVVEGKPVYTVATDKKSVETTSVHAGDKLEYTAVLTPGYEIDEITTTEGLDKAAVEISDVVKGAQTISFKMPSEPVGAVSLSFTTKASKYLVSLEGDKAEAYIPDAVNPDLKYTAMTEATDSTVTFVAKAATDYEIVSVTVASAANEEKVYYALTADADIAALGHESGTDKYSFTMKPEALKVKVVAVPKTYTAQVKAAEGAKITSIKMTIPDPSNTETFNYVPAAGNTDTDVAYSGIEADNELEYTVTCSPGYTVDKVTVEGGYVVPVVDRDEDDELEETDISFDMPSETVTKGNPIVLTVTTKAIQYDVDLIGDTNSDVYVLDTTTGRKVSSAVFGTDDAVKFTAIADTDYEITSITVTGMESQKVLYALTADTGIAALTHVDGSDEYSFIMVPEDVEVDVDTRAKTYTAEVKAASEAQKISTIVLTTPDPTAPGFGFTRTEGSTDRDLTYTGITAGTKLAYKVTCAAGYTVDQVTAAGGYDLDIAVTGDKEEVTIGFVMPGEAVTSGAPVVINVTTKPLSYDLIVDGDYEDKLEPITITASGTAKTLTNGKTQVATDEPVVITVTATADYVFADESITLTGIATDAVTITSADGVITISYTQPAKDVTLKVNLETVQYALTVNDAEATAKYVTVTAEPGTAAVGDPIQVTLEYKDGYSKGTVEFKDKKGTALKAGSISSSKLPDGTVIKEVYSLEMVSGGINLTVGKKCRTYSVTTSSTNAEVNTSAKNSKASTEDEVEITAVPADDYSISAVEVVSASDNSKVYFADPVEAGSETPALIKVEGKDNTWKYIQPADDVVIVVITAAVDYKASIEATADAKATVAATAEFADRTVKEGTKLVTSNVHTGDVVSYEVTNSAGYRIAEESIVTGGGVDDVEVSEPDENSVQIVSFTMPSKPENGTASISFTTTAISYLVTLSGEDVDAYMPDDVQPELKSTSMTYATDSTVVFKVKADHDFEVADIIVTSVEDEDTVYYALTADLENGVQALTPGEKDDEGYDVYSFTMKPDDLVVTVVAADKTYDVQVKAAADETKIKTVKLTTPDPTAPGFPYEASESNTDTDVTYSGIKVEEDLVFTVSCNTGYTVADVSTNFDYDDIDVDTEDEETTITFPMPGEAVTGDTPFVITVTTMPLQYDVDLFGENAEAYVTDAETGRQLDAIAADMDSTVTFTAKADPDFEISAITVTGMETKTVYYALEADEQTGTKGLTHVEGTDDYSFVMVPEDVEVDVDTVAKTYSAQVKAAEGAKIESIELIMPDPEAPGFNLVPSVNNTDTDVTYSGIGVENELTYDITCEDGYTVDSVTVNYAPVELDSDDEDATISFEMPGEEVTGGNPVVVTVFTKPLPQDIIIAGDYENKLEAIDVRAGDAVKELKDGKTQAYTDDPVVITLTPTKDYYFDDDSIEIDGVDEDDVTVTATAAGDGLVISYDQPAEAVTLTVKPVGKLYSLNITDREAEKYVAVTADPEAVAFGETMAVTLEYKDGYSKGSVEFTDNDGNVLKAGSVSSEKLPDGTVIKEVYSLEMASGGINLTIGKTCRTYSVTTSATNAQVTTSAKNSKASTEEEVEITVVPADDYSISAVKVVSASDNSKVYFADPVEAGSETPALIKVEGKANTWQYIQPADDVIIIADTVSIPYTAKVKAAANAHAVISAVAGIAATGNGTKEVTVANVNAGDELKFIITPDTGYKVDATTIASSEASTEFSANTAEDGTMTLTMAVPSKPENGVVTMTFDTVAGGFAIGITEANAEVKGIVEGDAAYGSKVEFEVAPAADYKLPDQGAVTIYKTEDSTDVSQAVGLSKNAGTGKWSFTMPAYGVTIYATAEMIYYPVEVAQNENVTVVADAETAVKGTKITVSANFATGYVIDKISVIGLSDGKTVASMTADAANNWEYIQPSGGSRVSVTAKPGEFAIQSREMMATITDLPQSAYFGSKVEFSAVATTGYKLVDGSVKILDMAGNDISEQVDLTGDTGTLFTDGSFAFTMSAQPVKISVEAAKKDSYKLSYEYDKDVVQFISALDKADEGDVITLTVKTIKGYDVKSFKIVDAAGNEIETIDTASFRMPSADVTVTIICDRKDNGETTEQEDFYHEVSKNYASMAGAMGSKVFEGPLSVIASQTDDSCLIQNYRKGKVNSLSISENSTGETYVTINAGCKVIGLSRGSYTVVSAYNGTEWTGVSNLKMPKIDKKGILKLKKIKNVPIYTVCLKGPKGLIRIRVIDVKFDPQIKKATINSNPVTTSGTVSGNSVSGNSVSGNSTEGIILDVTDSVFKSTGLLNGVWKVGKDSYVTQVGVRQLISVNSKVSVYATVMNDGTLLVEPVTPVKAKVNVKYNLNGKVYKTKLDLSNVGVPASKVAYREMFVKGFEVNKNQIVVVNR